MTLSEILLRLLQKYHLSQRKLAEKSAVNYVTINRIINDEGIRTTSETIRKLANGLECSEKEHDEMLAAAKRIPETIETKFGESPNAARLFRRISELDTEAIDELLKLLEDRKRNNEP
ncbi:MAG TPA: helix-turn-helix transcriptional regulator [Terriglobales bacterium]|nr:helix-turn-helix transcriptional regulator [Terriglobales bacterium]